MVLKAPVEVGPGGKEGKVLGSSSRVRMWRRKCCSGPPKLQVTDKSQEQSSPFGEKGWCKSPRARDSVCAVIPVHIKVIEQMHSPKG